MNDRVAQVKTIYVVIVPFLFLIRRGLSKPKSKSRPFITLSLLFQDILALLVHRQSRDHLNITFTYDTLWNYVQTVSSELETVSCKFSLSVPMDGPAKQSCAHEGRIRVKAPW